MSTTASTIRAMQPQQQEQTWTVRRLLEWTSGFFSRKNVDPARLSAELLLAHVLNVPRIKLYTDYERPLSEAQLMQFRELVRRAGEHEPIAYLTGKAHFVTIELGDLYEPLSRIVDARPFNLIVANPPYIPSAQIDALDRSVRDYEPKVALDGGADGLSTHRRILAGAGEHLVPDGQIFLEI